MSLTLQQVWIPQCVRGFESESACFDVQIEADVVTAIRASRQPAIQGTLIPALVDLHVHLDKTYVVDQVGAAEGDLFKAINLMAAHRSTWTTNDLHTRMQRALLEAWQNGTRAMRTHLDWVQIDTPKSLAVFQQLREEWRDRIALQCVALTPLDEFDSLNHIESIAAQLAKVNSNASSLHPSSALLGAFVYRNERLAEKLQTAFNAAKKFNLDLDFHVDEGLDADATGLGTIAQLTLHNHWQGRVTCGHACSLSVQTLAQARATLALCAQAGIHLVALPSTNLYLQGDWAHTPVERGITRLTEAHELGVSTSIATDNVADGFFPYGSYDLLDTFALGVQAAHLRAADAWLASITTRPAHAMGLAWDGKIAAGCPADLVLLTAKNRYEVVTPQGRRRRVIRAGRYIETSA